MRELLANGGRCHLLVCTVRSANGERPAGGYHAKAQVSSAMQASMVATSVRSQRLPGADIALQPREVLGIGGCLQPCNNNLIAMRIDEVWALGSN
jgi:hypothetical protein